MRHDVTTFICVRRVQSKSTVVSTSTRNFPNRLGDGANVFLSSAELAAISSILGRLPTPEEYLSYATQIDTMATDVYRYAPCQITDGSYKTGRMPKAPTFRRLQSSFGAGGLMKSSLFQTTSVSSCKVTGST